MLPGEFANTNAGFKGQRHHLPAERVIVRTSPLSHNLDPLHRSSHCGCHSGCLTSVIRHDPKLNATRRAAQGAEIGRLHISRFKRIIGDGPRARNDRRRATEVAIAMTALYRMLALGRPEYVRLP
jgi:hypothetical protein